MRLSNFLIIVILCTVPFSPGTLCLTDCAAVTISEDKEQSKDRKDQKSRRRLKELQAELNEQRRFYEERLKKARKSEVETRKRLDDKLANQKKHFGIELKQLREKLDLESHDLERKLRDARAQQKKAELAQTDLQNKLNLATELAKKNAALAEKQKQTSKSHVELQKQLRQQQNQFRQQLRTAENQIRINGDEYRRQLAEAKRSAEKTKSTDSKVFADTKAKLDASNNQLTELRDQLLKQTKAMQKAKELVDESNASQNTELLDARTKLDESAKEIAVLRKQLNQQKEAIETTRAVQQQLANLNRERKAGDEQLEKLRKQLADTKKHNRSLLQKAEIAYTNRLSEHESKIADLKTQVAASDEPTYENDAKELTRELKKANAELKILTAANARKEEELKLMSGIQAQNDATIAALEQAQEKLASAQMQKEYLRSQLKKARSEQESQTSESQATAKRLKKTIENRDAELSQLKIKLAELSKLNKEKALPTPKPRLGVYMQARPGDTIIRRIDANSAGEAAGLRVGDSVTNFGGKTITTFSQLGQAVGDYVVGDEITVTYRRDGKTRTTTVKLKADNR